MLKVFGMHSSTFILLASNLFAIVLALILKWDLSELMWIYWAQSVIIGFYQGCRMMSLERFSTEGFTSNGRPVPETPAGKRSTVVFFAIHYGFFHFVYSVFLFAHEKLSLTKMGYIGLAASIVVFAVNHHYSFVANRKRDSKRVPNLGKMMFFPYLRILPMHVTIIFGSRTVDAGGLSWGLLLFLLLKTGSDVAMHMIEHREKAAE